MAHYMNLGHKLVKKRVQCVYFKMCKIPYYWGYSFGQHHR